MTSADLPWVGLDWAGLGWVGLGWVGLFCVVLCCGAVRRSVPWSAQIHWGGSFTAVTLYMGCCALPDRCTAVQYVCGMMAEGDEWS